MRPDGYFKWQTAKHIIFPFSYQLKTRFSLEGLTGAEHSCHDSIPDHAKSGTERAEIQEEKEQIEARVTVPT